jgi:hypothetical protein
VRETTERKFLKFPQIGLPTGLRKYGRGCTGDVGLQDSPQELQALVLISVTTLNSQEEGFHVALLLPVEDYSSSPLFIPKCH